MRIYNKSLSSNYILFSIFILINIDYILTFIGINQLNYITEGNPLLSNLFNLQFITGLGLRCMQAAIPVSLLFAVKNKIEILYFKNILLNIIYLQICILIVHLYWIIHYSISFFY